MRRPAPDPINSLLSLSATLLIEKVNAMVRANGLEPNLGALHCFVPGRPSLACDLVEPLRATSGRRGGPLGAESDFDPLARSCRFQGDRWKLPDRQAEDRIVLAHWERHWDDGDFNIRTQLMIAEYISKIREQSPVF